MGNDSDTWRGLNGRSSLPDLNLSSVCYWLWESQSVHNKAVDARELLHVMMITAELDDRHQCVSCRRCCGSMRCLLRCSEHLTRTPPG